MKLLVGLGNPGTQYAKNRHNIGFMAMDALHAQYNFPQWRQKFSGEFSKGLISGESVLLLKPLTFMNLSGQSIGEAARFHKIPIEDIYVFHDELDLAPAKLRHKISGGVAGHNGLKSTRQHIGENFHRIRMGVGHPGDRALVTNWVLGDFSKSDHETWLDLLLEKLPYSLPLLLEKGGDRFVSDLMRHLKENEQGKKSKDDAAAQINDNSSLSKKAKQDIPASSSKAKKTESPFASLQNLFNRES